MDRWSDVIVREGNLFLRLMRDSEEDYARVVAWRNTPHVREWWDPDDPPMTMQEAVTDLRPSIVGKEPDRAAFIEIDGRPIGFIQFYPWAPYAAELEDAGLSVPEGAWGLDLYIGDPDWVNRGIGARTVRVLSEHLFRRGAAAIAFGVEVTNARARRAYEKAGMRPIGEYLDTDTRGGERVRSVFLLRTAAGGGDS